MIAPASTARPRPSRPGTSPARALAAALLLALAGTAGGCGGRTPAPAEGGGEDAAEWVEHDHGLVEGLPLRHLERVYAVEGGQHRLVDTLTGRWLEVDARPVPSPDRSRFVTASADLVAGHAPNRVRVYRASAGEPRVEWEAAPSDWGARAPVWADDATVRLERVMMDWLEYRETVEPMVLRRRPGGWEVEHSAAHARQTLLSFLSALAAEHWPEAARLYGGSYEVLRGWNPDVAAGEAATLLRLGCSHNGLVCLGRAEILREERVSDSDTRLFVRLLTADGETFAQGPCCGETEESMPPVREFGFTVRRVADGYRVLDLPPYAP